MSSRQTNINRRVTARVTRIEEYALYLEFDAGNIIVLIPDVASDPQHLKSEWQIGDEAVVRLWRYIESEDIYKGTIREAALDTPERGSQRNR
ncbi:MAG: hypothetical protein HOW73_34895 [Polyangiaceae bacterium]|nr:hypothetical protein [Polyangiaceae bacterium]